MRDRVVEVSELGPTFMELLCRMELEAELEDLEHAELEERLLLAMDHSTPPVLFLFLFQLAVDPCKFLHRECLRNVQRMLRLQHSELR